MTFINVLGLMTGITCCLLIGLYIQHEYSYDRFQQKGDRIARVLMEYRFFQWRCQDGKCYQYQGITCLCHEHFPKWKQAYG